jgi:SWI/SNF chromatin-remodeling complex subunit SWI1
MLEQMYTGILFPFEDIYKKNLQEQQRKAQLASRQIPLGQPGQIRTMPTSGTQQVPSQIQRVPVSTMGMMGQPVQNVNGAHYPAAHTPQTPHQRSTLNAQVPQHNMTSQAGLASGSETNLLDSDIQGIKRKLDTEDPDGKRARQKTGMSFLSLRFE